MAVTSTHSLAEGLYIPFSQSVRGGPDGRSPVGTVNHQAADIGDGSGGTVILIMTMDPVMFGFRALVAPTFLSSRDTLATPEAVRVRYQASGRRLSLSLDQMIVPVAGSGGSHGEYPAKGVVMEASGVASQALTWTWSTNTNTIVYEGHVFASVFDAEVIEKYGSISEFLAGTR